MEVIPDCHKWGERELFILSLIHLHNKYLLSANSVLGIVLGIENVVLNKSIKVSPFTVHLWGQVGRWQEKRKLKINYLIKERTKKKKKRSWNWDEESVHWTMEQRNQRSPINGVVRDGLFGGIGISAVTWMARMS